MQILILCSTITIHCDKPIESLMLDVKTGGVCSLWIFSLHSCLFIFPTMKWRITKSKVQKKISTCENYIIIMTSITNSLQCKMIKIVDLFKWKLLTFRINWHSSTFGNLSANSLRYEKSFFCIHFDWANWYFV